MKGQGPTAITSETVTQESLLLAAVERIVRIREGRLAVHLHLSRLRPQNRQDGHLRIALRMLTPMVNAYRGQIFLLGDSDIVFLVKDADDTDVENMVFKLRALFSKDPLTFDDNGDGIDHFCTWYRLDAGDNYEVFLDVAHAADGEAKKRGKQKRETAAGLPPLSSKELSVVLDALANADVKRLIRRQSAIVMNERTAEVLFQEFYVAVGELQNALSKDYNLLGNRWLFQHLSVTLDELVLDALADMPFQAVPGVYSLNLNLSSVLSRQFKQFEARVAGRTRISVELQILDVLGDSRAYFEVRDKLRAAGHQVVVDGISALTTKFMDVSQFAADLYKLSWSPELRESDPLAGSNLKPETVILARCDSEGAIQWGLERGIARFQGRHVDAMLAAYTMAGCKEAQACTLQQCITRHGLVTGPVRNQCGNLPALDASPVMRAPKVHPSKAGPP